MSVRSDPPFPGTPAGPGADGPTAPDGPRDPDGPAAPDRPLDPGGRFDPDGRDLAVARTREKVTGAISWTLIPRLTQVVVSVFTSILIVRTLHPFDYGTLSVLRTLLVMTVTFCGFGLGQAINRFIPELRVTDRREVGRALLYRSLLLQGGIWVILSVALIILRPVLKGLYPTYADLLVLGVVISIAEIVAGTVSQYAISSYRTGQMAAASVAGTVVLAGGTALLLHVGLRVDGVLEAAAASWAANTAVLIFLLRKQGGRTRTAAAPFASPAVAASGTGKRPVAAAGTDGRAFPWSRLLVYALPWIPNNFLNYVVWRQSETFLLGVFRTRVEAGFFDLAYKLPQLILEFVPTAVYPLVLAGFAETATVARDRMKDVISTYYRLLFFVVAPLCLLGLAMGDVLLARMYGRDMAVAGPYCQAFFAIFTISYFGTPLSMTVYVVEKVWVNLVLNVGYAIVTLGLDLLLIPRYGLIGATIPTGLVTAITPIVRYYVARRYLPDVSIPWAFIGRCFLASSPLLGLYWAKAWATNLKGLALLLLAAGFVLVLSYRFLRVLGREEREFLSRTRIPGKALVLRIL